ncbi:MAG TPA: Re/Si-specific NAD(P)(+) transhydrogenase subunit alpha [Longimicrobiales bacterium]|nr:Re/Si-specific NAD(P)(+) transhydrogenase subunit alpha [Longimicrobiales bacterium]
MKIVVPKESAPGERRVALVPESVGRLVAAGLEVHVEEGAGTAAGFTDAAYAAAGASTGTDRRALLGAAGLVICVKPLPEAEVAELAPDTAVMGMLRPLNSPAYMQQLAAAKVRAVAMEMVPRITRAQKMDVLSSQATVAGYRAVLLAAGRHSRFFPMLMTAAGTIPPARVLVLGAGVAGLQAIATARRLGAVVQGFDIRPAVKEQVESLGAQWVGMQLAEAEGAGGYAAEVSEETQRKEHEHLHALVKDADVVITTAQIPGKPAPVLITEDMVDAMKPGAIIVDLAAESGGNCTLTRVDEDVSRGGALILGPSDLAAGMPGHASQMYSRNVEALVQHLWQDGELRIDADDEIVKECLVTAGGEVVHPRVSASILQETGS